MQSISKQFLLFVGSQLEGHVTNIIRTLLRGGSRRVFDAALAHCSVLSDADIENSIKRLCNVTDLRTQGQCSRLSQRSTQFAGLLEIRRADVARLMGSCLRVQRVLPEIAEGGELDSVPAVDLTHSNE